MHHTSAAARENPSVVGVFTTDAALRIRTWDAWLARATGIPPESARGRALTDVVPDLAERGLLRRFERVLAGGIVEILAPALHHYLIPCPPAAPSTTFDRMQQSVTIAPLRESGRLVGTIVAIEDVTARVEREREVAARLASSDPDVRREAASLLDAHARDDEAGAVIEAMGDENWRARRTAVEALRRSNSVGVIAAVLSALRDDRRNLAALSSAIELLIATEVDVVQPLLELLRHQDPDVRLQAALVLGGRSDTRAAAALMQALEDPDENVRFHAIEALGRIKAIAAVDALASIAESEDFFVAFPAVEALAQIGDPGAAPRLAPLLRNELLRSTVTDALGEIGDEDVVAPLTQLLNEASAPTEVIADALARLYDRYLERYGDGEPIAQLVRRTIAATGTQNLLDAIQSARPDQLKAVAKVLGWLEGAAVDRALTRLLGKTSIRGQVVESLVRHGARVVDLLIEQLRAEDLDTREAAIVGLGRIGDRRATRPLLDVMASEPALTIVTAGALARIGDAEAFEPLLARIGDRDAAVRQAVIAALNSIGHPGMPGRIAPLLRDPEPHVRESAVRIAGYFGYGECASVLLDCCHDPDPAVRRAAVEHAAFFDDPRVAPTLLEALSTPEPVIRSAAAQALGRVDDPWIEPPLVAALADPDPWVRYFAARALGEPRRSAAVSDLALRAFDDPAGQVRLAAIDALGRIASAAAIPALASLSATADLACATAAVHALGGIAHPDAWPPLQACLRADEPERRASAAHALARQGGVDAAEVLAWTAAADSDETVAAAAIDGLRTLALAGGGTAPQAVAALVRLAADDSRRELVIAALAALPPALVADVGRGLRDPDPCVRMAVLRALGRMRRSEASRLLQAGLDDEAEEVRLAALVELRHLGTRGLVRRVLMLARTDPDAAVRRAALKLLAGEPNREASRAGIDAGTAGATAD